MVSSVQIYFSTGAADCQGKRACFFPITPLIDHGGKMRYYGLSRSPFFAGMFSIFYRGIKNNAVF